MKVPCAGYAGLLLKKSYDYFKDGSIYYCIFAMIK